MKTGTSCHDIKHDIQLPIQRASVKALYFSVFTFNRTFIFKCIFLVNGGWTPWGPWSTCTVSCAGGTWFRTRNCTMPAPAYGGYECDGISYINATCNAQPCPGINIMSHKSIILEYVNREFTMLNPRPRPRHGLRLFKETHKSPGECYWVKILYF